MRGEALSPSIIVGDLVGGLLDEEGIDPSNVILTGSSLGGGLAAYVGSHLGIKTITFNAAGVHPDNVGPHIDMVTNYFLWGDILTKAQSRTPLPNAIGNQIGVMPTPGDFLIASSLGSVIGGYYLHFIGPMHRSLEKKSR